MIYFSPREKQVVALIQERALGRSALAGELGISEYTVRLYLRAIVQKLPPQYRHLKPVPAVLLWTRQGTPLPVKGITG